MLRRATGCGLVRERLSKTSLAVLSSVDKVGIVESQLDRAVDNMICGLHAQHERVVLIADLDTCLVQLLATVECNLPRIASCRNGPASKCPLLEVWVAIL